jgi:hypothetical protein
MDFHPNAIRREGQRQGLFTVIEYAGRTKNGMILWRCRCDCGNERVLPASAIGKTRWLSCGCNKAKAIGDAQRTHGQRHTRLYNIWVNMRARCFRTSDPAYPRYGGRGITVCPEWLTFEGFRDWALASGYQEDLTIERQDNDGKYEPGNCIWATYLTQARNQRKNHMGTAFGETKCWAEWIEDPRCMVTYAALSTRVYRGMDFEGALTTPPLRKKPWNTK